MQAGIQPRPLGDPDPRALQVMIPMRDGIRLAADVYLPEGWQEQAPEGLHVILVRLPYDKSDRYCFMSDVAMRFMEHGYATVVQDVRGKARSEGETLAFVHEVDDGYDTLEWIVGQPWSNGSVGSFGDSYFGFTQWAMIASGHPALKAAVPRMTTTKIADDWMYHDGVFNLGTMGEWALHAWIGSALNEPTIDWSVRPLANLVQHHAPGLSSPSFARWISEPPDSSYWTTDVYAGHEVIPGRIPTLHVGGFFDVFSRGQIADFQASQDGPASAAQYLNMGATDHFDDILDPSGRSPDHVVDDSVLDAFLDRYLEPAIEFFDAHLRGQGHAIPRVRWEAGHGGWHASEAWPPPQAESLTLHLSGIDQALDGPRGGLLASQPPALAGQVTWVHDPDNPVPTLIADPWRPLLDLPDERAVQSRGDVPTFTSAEFTDGLLLAGPVTARLRVRADAPSTHLVARLCDVRQDGHTTLIVEGIALVPGCHDDQDVTVDLGDTGYLVRPGHRLRLQVAASCFPRWVVHPGTDEDPMQAVSSRTVEHTLTVGSAVEGCVSVTFIPAGTTNAARTTTQQ